MTYADLSDQDIISLLEGKTMSQVLSTMDSTQVGDYKTIDDIYQEIMSMTSH